MERRLAEHGSGASSFATDLSPPASSSVDGGGQGFERAAALLCPRDSSHCLDQQQLIVVGASLWYYFVPLLDITRYRSGGSNTQRHVSNGFVAISY